MPTSPQSDRAPAVSTTEKGGAWRVEPTRGPWRTQGWVPTWAYIPIHDAAHNLVATLYPDLSHGYTREQVEANAHLIVAAPEMLVMLKRIEVEIGEGSAEGRAIDLLPDRTVKQLRAAITKAEGQS